MGVHGKGCGQTSLLVDSTRKQKLRNKKDKLEVAEILAKGKEYNANLELGVGDGKQPNRGRKLWLCIFPITIEATLKYDEPARAICGPFARLNLPNYKMASCNNSATTNTTVASATTSCSDFIITTSNHSEYDKIAVSIEASTPVSPSKKPRMDMTDVMELNDGGTPDDEDYFLNFSFDVNELIDAIAAGPICELGCEEVGVPLSGQGGNLPYM
ncbi:hypothetical protein Ancab_034535 [Ancistrocladus abbreviatus]